MKAVEDACMAIIRAMHQDKVESHREPTMPTYLEFCHEVRNSLAALKMKGLIRVEQTINSHQIILTDEES